MDSFSLFFGASLKAVLNSRHCSNQSLCNPAGSGSQECSHEPTFLPYTGLNIGFTQVLNMPRNAKSFLKKQT